MSRLKRWIVLSGASSNHGWVGEHFWGCVLTSREVEDSSPRREGVVLDVSADLRPRAEQIQPSPQHASVYRQLAAKEALVQADLVILAIKPSVAGTLE